MEEKYFVGSNGDEPLVLFFNQIDAFVSGYRFLDSFDECGKRVNSYEFVNEEYEEL